MTCRAIDWEAGAELCGAEAEQYRLSKQVQGKEIKVILPLCPAHVADAAEGLGYTVEKS